jgi:predicted amidohydrolase
VDLVFVSAYWLATDPEPQLSRHEHDPEYEKKLVQSWMFGRAVETESVWVLSNAVGKAEDGYMGGSGVWAPLRGKMAGFAGPEEGLVFAEVDLPNVLKDAKEAYKIREDYAKCKR